jgi:hypothetical protein
MSKLAKLHYLGTKNVMYAFLFVILLNVEVFSHQNAIYTIFIVRWPNIICHWEGIRRQHFYIVSRH